MKAAHCLHFAKLGQSKLHSIAGYICKDKEQGTFISKSSLTVITCHSLCHVENINEKFSEFSKVSYKDS